jgi:putative ABC transport system permease protein
MSGSNTLFGLPLDLLARLLGVAALVALGAVGISALRAPHLARISLRNVIRGRLRTVLVVVGLMSATTFLATALIINQTVFRAVEGAAVFTYGRVDEEVTTSGDPFTTDPLGLFPADQGALVQKSLASSPHVAGVTPALVVQNALIVDESSHQARAGLAAVGFASPGGGPLVALRSTLDGRPAPIEALGPRQAYLNRSAGLFLHADPGDTIALFSVLWPSQRYEFVVADVVEGGLLGGDPELAVPLDTLRELVNAPDSINRVYIANAGDGLSGVGFSDEIATTVQSTLSSGYAVHKDKLNGVRFALQTQATFTGILALFTLFALSINLLLVVLLFALLAEERRAELGVSRAVGLRRGAVLRLLVYEGAVYGAAAVVPGALAGIGLGELLIVLVRPTIAEFGFPLDLQLDLTTPVMAMALGLLFALLTTVVAASAVSGMNVAAALRGLPDPPGEEASLVTLVRDALRLRRKRSATGEALLAAWGRTLVALVLSGIAPAALAVVLLASGMPVRDSLRLGIGVAAGALAVALLGRSLAIGGVAMALRLGRRVSTLAPLLGATQTANAGAAAFVALALALYWLLPADPAHAVGLSRFGAGIQLFFVAGMFLVFSATTAVAFNFRLLLAPLRALARHVARLRHVTYIALVQPAAQRVRTGLSLAMLALICFTMVVMACISASIAERFGDLQAQAGGYDIVGRPLFHDAGGIDAVSGAVSSQAPGVARSIVATSAARPLPIAIVQPGAPDAGWRLYPVAQIDGAFLRGVGLPLAARATGYASADAVWQAVSDDPGAVVIDAGALPPEDAEALGTSEPPPVDIRQFVAPPIAAGLLGPSSVAAVVGEATTEHALAGLPPDARDLLEHPEKATPYTLRLQGIITGPGEIAPTPLWIADFRGGPPRKVTVIGVVDNAQGQRYGLLGSPQTFAALEQGLPAFGSDYYYFKLAPNSDVHEAARAIGAALLDDGFETTVITDGLLAVNGPHVLAARVLVGLVALTLLVAVIAFMVTGLRGVVERRQQIGMLRALGFHRRHVLALFALESLLVGALGVGVGLALGLLLCRGAFAVGLFDRFQDGLALSVPWGELALICGAALGVSLLAALLPAIQASQVEPAEALRYE